MPGILAFDKPEQTSEHNVMPDWILTVAATLLGVLIIVKGYPFVLGPVLIKATSLVLAAPEVEAIKPDAAPEEATTYFAQVDAALAKHGLRRLVTVAVRTAPNGPTSYAAMYLQAETRIVGLAAALPRPRQPMLTYTEFSSELADGTILTTNNSPIVSPYKPGPTAETLSFEWVHDPGAIYRVHRGRLAKAGKGAPKVPAAGTEVAFIQEAIEKPVHTQASFGFLTLDGAKGLYKCTWRGACRMTWLSLSPFKERREAAMKERALACMKGLKREKAAKTA